ncbi:TonB-dependent receptor domain-containing protein [Chitinimonas arctica]|nr:TonB-dependent receptor [Chitinimonas arctica]
MRMKQLAYAISLIGLTSAAQVYAEEATQKVEKIEVTGSRIVRTNLSSSTPVLTIGTDTMGNLGMENFADIATALPQFAPSFGSSRSQSTFSGAENSGLNQANLRNLGTNRTLVLINGRRVPGGLSTDTAVDFNAIPTANIERIEVITGGASAVYGSDAVAGVINIITKKNFEGIQLTLDYGRSAEGDNTNPSGSILLGGKFGEQGRGLLTVQWDKQGQVSCKDRYLCAEDFLWNDSAAPARRGPSVYSGIGLGGRFFIGNTSYTRRNGSFVDGNGQLIPFVTAQDGYNRNAQRDLAIPTTRLMVAGDADYKLNDKVKVYTEMNYAQTTTDSAFEGHPFQSSSDLVGGAVAPTIPRNNPFIPTALRNAMPADQTEMTWFQRFAGLGDRGANNDRTMVRVVGGIRGDMESLFGLGSDWRWDVSHVYGRTSVNLSTEGLVGLPELYNGLRVEADPANAGGYRCVDAVARGAGCVPINPFAPYTPAMANYLTKGSSAIGRSIIKDTIASLSGTAFELPAGAVKTSVGAEYRTFSGYLDFDPLSNQGLVTGNQVGDTDFVETKTREYFGEILVPILADKPLVHALNFEGAFRHSSTARDDYNTWKFGGDWAPIESLRFRAQKARAVRSPVPSELSGISTTAGVINDPCAAVRRNINGTRAANCAAAGVPADYAPPQLIDQGVQGFSGGNPNLKPEIATTLTYGMVWQPSFVKNLSITIDRFDVEIKDIITTVSRQTAVDLCYDRGLLCGSVTRGQHPLLPGANYVLRAVNEEQQNVAEQRVAGIDLSVNYNFKLQNYGAFDLSLLSTIYDKATFVPLVGEPELDLLGQAGGSTTDQGFIKMTASANVGYRLGKFKANWNMRHIGKAEMGLGSHEAGFPAIGAHTYHNIRVGYDFAKSSEVYAGITNLFDKKPPFFASGTSGTQALDTIPGYYDVFGRSYFVGLRTKF